MAVEGLPYGQRTMTYNSRLAQELAKWAERQDGGTAIHDAMYRAYFIDGLNIAQIDSLMPVVRKLGLPEDEVEKRLFWDATAFDLMKKWRVVHLPITLAFAVLGLTHIFSIFLFWQWK